MISDSGPRRVCRLVTKLAWTFIQRSKRALAWCEIPAIRAKRTAEGGGRERGRRRGRRPQLVPPEGPLRPPPRRRRGADRQTSGEAREGHDGRSTRDCCRELI